MSSLIAGLRSSILREIARAPLTTIGIKEYLKSGNLYLLDSSLPHAIEARVERTEQIFGLLASDFSRFSLAAFESFYRSRESGDQSLNYYAWRLLESYYAGFFAAHALMRSLGGGVSYLANEDFRALDTLADVYGIELSEHPPGSWCYEVVQSGADWKLILRTASPGSGVHDAFWRTFSSFLNSKAEDAVSEGLPDSSEFLARVVQLTDAISFGGAGTASWLSKIRNALNYQHDFEVWFPTRRSLNLEFRPRIESEGSDQAFRIDLSKSKDTLALFENVNSKIVHALWDVAELYSKISRKSGHFGARYSRFNSILRS